MNLFFLSLLLAQPPAAPLEVESAKARPDLTAQFTRTSGWTGADGAASVALGPKRTLWLFGDTWIGDVENGRRVKSRMVNNTVAWQDLTEPPHFRFFWDNSAQQPAAILKPEARDEWYWPGDGALVDGKLYLFCKVCRRKKEGSPGFQFDWFANDLLQIANPQEEPARWKVERKRLPEEIRFGSACVADGEYLYVFGLLPGKRKLFEAPLVLARLPRDKLANLDVSGWEAWADGRWSAKLTDAATLIRDGAPELTVMRVRGIDGFLMVSIPLGMGLDVTVRHADRPEGPWSAPLKVYRCPKEEKDVFTYAAKGHAELAQKDGQLIVTYCRNIGALGEHIKRPDVYAPQFVEIMLRKK